ncbi:hypothetical protein [Novipirellula rosea]|uniref:Uncharacterized protein n=1 Tax=Novipirellula rosea TaxID=1031540 RepID=A0ABP8MY51_9BACT
MTETTPTRALRIERLETRSLLAAGIFDLDLQFGSSTTDALPNDAAGQVASGRLSLSQRQPPSRHASIQNNGVQGNRALESRSLQFRSQGNAGQDFRSLGNGIDRIHDAPTSFRQDATLAQAQQSPTPTTLGVSTPTTPQSNPNVNDVANARRDVSPPLPQNSIAAIVPSAVDEVLASLQTASESDVALADQDAVTATQTVSTIAVSGRELASRVNATIDNDSAAGPMTLPTDTGDIGSDDVNDIQSGLIAPEPSLQLRPLQSLSDSEQNAWQLDDGILPRLQRNFQATLRVVPQQVDLSIIDWFSGPGGLIDLQRGNLPSRIGAITGDAINVQLESTMGYHRCLDLIAAGVVEPISGPLLDSILASIESMASEETQPVSDPTPLRISKLAYPAGAAIVAGSIAIAARRKQKHPQPTPKQGGLKQRWPQQGDAF